MGEYANTLGYKNAFILAPNYPAGKDSLNGFKRFYKGELAGELYTKLGQTDFAAEIAQIKASGADCVFFFLPGGMGISFIKQFSNADTGLPMMGPGFSFDQDVLPAVGDAAARRPQRRPVVARPRQPGQQGLRRGLRGRVRPPALGLRQPGLRHRAPHPLGQRHGRHRRPRRLPRGAEGRRLPQRPRQLQVRQQPAPDPELLRPRGGEARRRRHHQPDRRHRLREPRRRLRRRVPDAVTPRRRAPRPPPPYPATRPAGGPRHAVPSSPPQAPSVPPAAGSGSRRRAPSPYRAVPGGSRGAGEGPLGPRSSRRHGRKALSVGVGDRARDAGERRSKRRHDAPASSDASVRASFRARRRPLSTRAQGSGRHAGGRVGRDGRCPARGEARMTATLLIEQVLNGLQFGTMLFLMAAGLTLVFGVMGLINLAHGSLYMVGAFAAATAAAAHRQLPPRARRRPRRRRPRRRDRRDRRPPPPLRAATTSTRSSPPSPSSSSSPRAPAGSSAPSRSTSTSPQPSPAPSTSAPSPTPSTASPSSSSASPSPSASGSSSTAPASAPRSAPARPTAR